MRLSGRHDLATRSFRVLRHSHFLAHILSGHSPARQAQTDRHSATSRPVFRAWRSTDAGIALIRLRAIGGAV
jgi:hypothetical protein